MRRPPSTALIVLFWLAAAPAAAQPRHGLSTFGDLKYGPGFKHFDYADPKAPKGGEVKSWELETFDNLNPVILKGRAAAGLDLVFESLLQRAADEPDAMYGLLAESVELAPDRAWAAFNLDARARFHDGTPVTAADVVFSFNAIRQDGHPQYQLLYRDVEAVTAETARRVVYRFKPGDSRRDLPLLVATMPIFAAVWFQGRDFARTTLDAPLGSGPYRVERAEPGRTIVYRRLADYWGRDLAVNVGRYNFDVVRYEYFRDRDVAFEALFAGEYDYRVEVTARNWATGYDKPQIAKGQIKREVLADETPSGVQAFFLNTRRDKLRDRRVRAALNHAFDYAWLNKNLFFDLYKRTRSMFENSELAASGLPSAAELKLLEPYRAGLAREVFAQAFQSPQSDGSGNLREGLQTARRLFAEAGWTVKDGKLVDAKGERFTLEFLLYEASFNRVVNPYIRHLERLGIDATIRLVDVSTFENRMENFDYDVIVQRFTQPLTPGVEQRNYWGSAASTMIGGFNFSGVREPLVDALVEKIVGAASRADLLVTTRALDRVLMWNYYTIPHWYSGTFRLAYWDRFGRPALKPKYDLGLIDTWWIDAEREKLLPERRPTTRQ